MSAYLPYLLALGIGFIAGLRAMTAPAAIAWAAYLGWLPLAGTLAGLHGLALGGRHLHRCSPCSNWSRDQLPSTPSRKVPVQFGTRLADGRALPARRSAPPAGMLLGGHGRRRRRRGARHLWRRGRRAAALARAFGKDLPAALIEDAVAIGGAFLIVTASDAAMSTPRLRRHHHRRRPGRPAARRPPDRRRHDGRADRAQAASAAPASTPAACRPRPWSPAPMPRIWRAAPPIIGVMLAAGRRSTWQGREGARGQGDSGQCARRLDRLAGGHGRPARFSAAMRASKGPTTRPRRRRRC